MSRKILFHIGPQKCATTWVYQCLRDHPDIAAPSQDRIHYYDMHYHYGRAWYDAKFNVKNTHNNPCYFDPTYTYIRDGQIAKKIQHDFPDAKIIFALRHPIERAFSHYWHEKKKGKINHHFSDILNHYDLYADWVMPGLYATNIQPYIDCFGVKNILPVKCDDIQKAPDIVFRNICNHAGIDNQFIPDALHRRVNPRGAKQNIVGKCAYKIGNLFTRGHAHDSLFWQKIAGIENMNTTISDDLYKKLYDIFLPDIESVEQQFGISLAEWK